MLVRVTSYSNYYVYTPFLGTSFLQLITNLYTGEINVKFL
ncbi:hypothetical protein H1P_890010 [Hyella patelloides LEGE 07179]|uniref:Uncharacterized protein n=1 Tax=Hyella patelloides LEGE 07179 TaxID=945734 RepID=A0A563W530_9CYAN|nr:hypothetical protein H1P_890010 [Hyella patelloides LEGE 07179]